MKEMVVEHPYFLGTMDLQMNDCGQWRLVVVVVLLMETLVILGPEERVVPVVINKVKVAHHWVYIKMERPIPIANLLWLERVLLKAWLDWAVPLLVQPMGAMEQMVVIYKLAL